MITLFWQLLVFDFANIPMLFPLELIKSIFTVSICPSSSLLSYCILLSSDSSCHIPSISSYMMGIFEVGGWIHSIYMCLYGSVVVSACIVSVFLTNGIKFLVYSQIIQNCCVCSLGLYSPCHRRTSLLVTSLCSSVFVFPLIISIIASLSFSLCINCSFNCLSISL